MYSGVRIIRSRTTKGFTIRGSYNQGSYIQWFFQSGVLTIRAPYNQRSLQSGALHSGVLTTRSPHNQGVLQLLSYKSGVLTVKGPYDQGFYQLGDLTIRGSYNQRLKSTCLTWRVCAQILIKIVNSHIECVSSAQMFKLTFVAIVKSYTTGLASRC